MLIINVIVHFYFMGPRVSFTLLMVLKGAL